MMPAVTWVRRARLLSIHDGDTICAALDMGFGLTWGAPNSLRILGTNAPELATPEGVAARDFVVSWLAGTDAADRWGLVVQTVKPDKFGGRFDAHVWRVSDGASLAEALLASGHGKVWSGHGPKP